MHGNKLYIVYRIIRMMEGGVDFKRKFGSVATNVTSVFTVASHSTTSIIPRAAVCFLCFLITRILLLLYLRM